MTRSHRLVLFLRSIGQLGVREGEFRVLPLAVALRLEEEGVGEIVNDPIFPHPGGRIIGLPPPVALPGTGRRARRP